jgi:glycyl-tRNA synthetase beta chain
MIPVSSRVHKNSALLEVGCEELPAILLPAVIDNLRELALSALLNARIGCGSVEVGGTPVRLVLRLDGLDEHTMAQELLVPGPPMSAAAGWPANSSPAVLGFARSQGVSPESLEVVDLPKGSYLAVRKIVGSRSIFEVLPGVCSAILSGLTFPKSMRWGQGTGPFLRPVLWILALYGDEVVGFDFAGQVSGRLTYAPRFRGGEPVLIRNVSQYDREIEAWDLELDLPLRQEKIKNDLYLALKLEENAETWPEGLSLILDPDLLLEVACLVEGYRVVPAVLPEKFRSLPPPVIRTVLKVHQRFFVLDSLDRKNVAHFLGVSGNPSGDLETIREGYIRVVCARLEDAAYYIHRDLARTLSDRLPELDGVVFFPGVGSLGDKVRATRRLVLESMALLPDDLIASKGMTRELLSTVLDRAATLYKADLLTGLVKEFPELEGEVGGIYYRREQEEKRSRGSGDAESPEIAAAVERAIASQYQPRTYRDSCPDDLPSALLSVCDRAIGQAGAFLGGANPTGSLDPFALRRAGTGMIRLLVEHGFPIRLSRLATMAIESWNIPDKKGVLALLVAFWEDRLLSVLSRDGELLWGRAARLGDEPPVISFRRAEFLRGFADSPDFTIFETVKTRIDRILPEGYLPSVPDAMKCAAHEEKVLWNALENLSRPSLLELPEVEDFNKEVELLRPLLPLVEKFFDAVLVNDPDPDIRSNRLALLSVLASRLSCLGSLNQLLSAGRKERTDG